MKNLKLSFGVVLLVTILFGGCSTFYQMEKTTTYPDGRIVVEKPVETPGAVYYDYVPRYPSRYYQSYVYQQPSCRRSVRHHSIIFNYSVGEGLKIYSQPKHHNKVSRNNNRETRRRGRR